MSRRRPTEFFNPLALRYVKRRGMATYFELYNKGWRASKYTERDLDDWPDCDDDAFLDGYLDYASGRDRYHLPTCPNHDEC